MRSWAAKAPHDCPTAPTTGTVGVLETAAICGLINLLPVLAQPQAATLHGSPRLFAEALARNAARKSRPSS